MARMAAKDRREVLIDAALRVMTREGVAKATTRTIVHEAGMNLGAFHYCFDSREALLHEVITRVTDNSVAKARKAFAAETDLRCAISNGLQSFWEGVELAPGEHLAGYELAHYALRQPGMEDLARRQYGHFLEVIEELFTEAAASANIQWNVPVSILARYLNSVLDGLTLCWLVDRDSERSREVLGMTADYLMTLVDKPARTEAESTTAV
ncbi:TetR family transcriptional regulator [Nocardia sp. NPDC052112]|uniref:TetR/AcrR family transcriptional regulator n=1 Tax=Nocardia sp. NPDC052112 TaxID=3155646 RepID=UPI003444815D